MHEKHTSSHHNRHPILLFAVDTSSPTICSKRTAIRHGASETTILLFEPLPTVRHSFCRKSHVSASVTTFVPRQPLILASPRPSDVPAGSSCGACPRIRGVNLGGGQAAVPQDFLDRAQVRAAIEQMRGGAVPQGMRTGGGGIPQLVEQLRRNGTYL